MTKNYEYESKTNKTGANVSEKNKVNSVNHETSGKDARNKSQNKYQNKCENKESHSCTSEGKYSSR